MGGGAYHARRQRRTLLVADGGERRRRRWLGLDPQRGHRRGQRCTAGNADTNGQPGGPVTEQGAAATGGGGGLAGTQTAGGDGGPGGGAKSSSSCSFVAPGAIGNPGSSSQGGGIPPDRDAGAGGGGGYFGGGQGGSGGSVFLPCAENNAGAGGGGGGSSFTGGPGVSGAVVNDSPSAPASLGGNGEVIISYLLPPLAVTTTSLPAATGGHSYAATLAATGGLTPYSWSVPPGTLPPGLSLSSAGVISGIPDVAGTYTFTVKVTDAENPAMTATKTLSITVSGPVITAAGASRITVRRSGRRLRPDYLGPGYRLARATGSRSCRVSVSFGGHPALVVFVTPTEIAVVAPPGTGTVTVTVTVGGVSSQATAATEFTYEYGFGLSRFLP